MANEPTVRRGRLPRGYSLVLKGNVYITANCRKQTQTANQTVYLVVNAKDKHIGIAVPSGIHEDVQQKEAETRDTRAANVDRRDNAIKREFEQVILQEFPQIPREDLLKILHQALEKRAGKVGRTGQLSDRKKANLAVRAYIRHCHTPYEQLLKGTRRKRGVKAKVRAREIVQGQVNELARIWAQGRSGQSDGQRSRPAKATKTISSPVAEPTQSRQASMNDTKRSTKPVRSRLGRVSQSATALTKSSATGSPDRPDAALPSSQRSVKTRRQIPREVIDLTVDDDENEDDCDEDWEPDEEDEEEDDDDDLPDLMVTAIARHPHRRP